MCSLIKQQREKAFTCHGLSFLTYDPASEDNDEDGDDDFLLMFDLDDTDFCLEIHPHGSYWIESYFSNGWMREKNRSFSYVFEHVPKEIQEQMIFYLDVLQ